MWPPGAERVLVDPMGIDPSARTTLDHWQPDKEGRQLAYQLSSGGDEESLLRVIDVASGEVVDGPIDRCRYSAVAWLPGGKAFYYVRRLAPDQVPEGESQFHRRVYLHVVGTPPESDAMVFGEGRDKTTYYGVSVSMDGRWLVISASIGTAPRDDVWLADLTTSDPAAPVLVPVTVGLDAQTSLRAGRDGRLYVFTDLDAPRGRICVADPSAPGPDRWRDLVGEDPSAVLRGYAILDELPRPVLVVSRTRHAISEVSVHDLGTGETLSVLDLPGLGSVGGIAERPEGGHEAWFGYTDYTTPPVVLRYDAASGALDTWATSPGSVASPPTVTASQVTYHSADGTPVRMVIWSRAGESRNRSEERPAILYGYGGFDVSMTPGYSANILAWVEAGGVYAVAGLRGGSEEGEEWHRAGMLDRKQNVFDDFHAAAEYLVASRDHVAGAARGLGRVERRAARRGRGDPAARRCSRRRSARRRCSTWCATSGSGSARRGTPSTGPRRRLRSSTWLLGVLAVPPRAATGPPTPRCCSPCSQRHPGRPAARVQDVRGAAVRVGVRPAGAVARGGAGGARAAGGVAVGRAGR